MTDSPRSKRPSSTSSPNRQSPNTARKEGSTQFFYGQSELGSASLKKDGTNRIYIQGKKLTAQLKKNVKWLFGTAIVILSIALVLTIVVVVPQKIQRNDALSAFQEGRYEDSFRLLRAYLNNHPTDYEASYYAARAALYNLDIQYADSVLTNLYSNNTLPEERHLPYYYALVKFDQPDHALMALDKLIARYPDHVKGRLLRGLLLGNTKQLFHKAREDFLHVDNIIRGSSEDFSDLRQLYRYMQLSDRLSIYIEADVTPPDSSTSPLSIDLGFDVGLDGYINRYQLSSGSAFVNDELSANTIVLLLFTHVLLVRGNLGEATRELKEVHFNNLDSPSVKQTQALLQALQGEHKTATQLFSELAQQLPTDTNTLNNIAVANWSANPTMENIDSTIELFNDVLMVDKNNYFALNNSAFLYLIQGNYDQAGKKINLINNLDFYQMRLNRGILSLLHHQFFQALTLFSTIPQKVLPTIDRYRAITHIKKGEQDAAINVYYSLEQQFPDDRTIPLKRIQTMVDSGNERVAFDYLQVLFERYPNDEIIRYHFALLALQLGENTVFETQQNRWLNNGQADSHFLNALRGFNAHQQGKTKLAIDAFARAIKQAPDVITKKDYVVAWSNLVVRQNPSLVIQTIKPLLSTFFDSELAALLAYAQIDSDIESALELSRLALKDGYPSPITRHYAGAVLTRSPDEPEREKALPLLESAQQWSPTDASLLKALQSVYQASGNTDLADRTGKIITYLHNINNNQGPSTSTAYQINIPPKLSEQAKIAVSEGSPEATAIVLKEYDRRFEKITKPEKIAHLLRSRASFFAFLHRYSEAAQDFYDASDTGLSHQDEKNYFMLFLTEVLMKEKRYDEAEQILTELSTANGEAPLYNRLQARILSKTQPVRHAQDLLKRSIAAYPADYISYYELAQLYYQHKDVDNAIYTLKQLIRVNPDYTNAYKLLSELYNTQGKQNWARDYLNVYSYLSQRSIVS